MATNLQVAARNTAPNWVITCQRKNADGTFTAINLSGCTVHLIIAKGATITNANALASITTAASGIISYSPLVADIPLKGTYKIDVKITYGNSTEEVLYDQLRVKARARII